MARVRISRNEIKLITCQHCSENRQAFSFLPASTLKAAEKKTYIAFHAHYCGVLIGMRACSADRHAGDPIAGP